MKRLIAFCLLVSCSGHVRSQPKPSTEKLYTPLIQVDYERLVTRADLNYSQPVVKSEAGQPIGNGEMGSLVWTTPSQIKLQVNRTDIFGNNSSSNNFYERNTEYLGAAAWIDLDFGEQLFTAPHYQQRLSCYKGVSTVKGNGVTTAVAAWQEDDVMMMQVTDKRADPDVIMVNLRMLRPPKTVKGNHTAISKLEQLGDDMVLRQTFQEDDYYCASAVVMGISGRSNRVELLNESTMRLAIASGGDDFTVFIASAASFNPKEDVVKLAQEKLLKAKRLGYQRLQRQNEAWWANFWKQSYVQLTSADGEADYVEQQYTYYLYIMAASSQGKYPAKFNGMLWATGGDRRQWGTNYWGANQSCLYNALFATNHWELLDPMFNMYSNAYDTFERAAQQQWGSKGIYIPETMGFDGVPALPEAIAKEMRALYLLQKPWEERSKAFMDYAETQMPFLSRWNWKHTGTWEKGRWKYNERGDGPYGPVNHLFSRGAKIAYQYWQRYEYTGDIRWLKERAYPMLKGMAEFYRNFPNVKKAADGKYHIYHVNDNESIWGGHNTVEEMASMHGILPVVIKASEILKVDEAMRPIWRAFLADLAPLTTSRDYPDMPRQPEVWVGSLPPTSPIRGNGKRLPDRNTMPVWFFDLCNPGSNPHNWEIANNTFDGYFETGVNSQVYPYVLSKLPIAGATLGRADAVRYLVPNQMRREPKYEVMPNLLDVSEGFYTTNLQRLGRAAEALQMALCFNGPEHPGGESIIRVFHAWPKEWDACFNLLARNNFMVSARMQQGQIEFVELCAQGNGIGRLQNPWPGKKVALFRNGKQEKITQGEVLVLQASENERITVVPAGVHPSNLNKQ